MKKTRDDISLADLNNIPASKYRSVKITELPFTIRQLNALVHSNYNTLEDVLNLSTKDLYNIRNLGRGSVNGIIEYAKSLDDGNSRIPEFETRHVNAASFRQYREQLLNGQFDEILNSDRDSIDDELLDLFQNAYRDTDIDLLRECVQEPERMQPYIEMLNGWYRHRELVKRAIYKIPKYRLRNKALGYINAYANINSEWDYDLPGSFDKSETLETLLRNSDSCSWKSLARFVDWCAKDIKEITNSFINELRKNEKCITVINSRRDKKTLEEVGQQFGVTRERIRQIEMKARKRASIWAKHNRILRLMSADLNDKTVMTVNDFNELLGDNGGIVFFLLTDSDEAQIEGFVYSKTYNVYTFGDDLDFSAEEEFIGNLPAVIPANEYNDIIERAKDIDGISEDQFLIVFESEYELHDNYYKSRYERLSLTQAYTSVLEKRFKNGIHVHCDKDLELFKKYVFEDFGLDIVEKSNRSVDAIVSRIGIVCDRGVIKPKNKDYLGAELKEKIRVYIKTSRNPLIMINSIYSIFEKELNKIGIDNRYYLQGVMKEEFLDEFYITRDYISREPVTETIYSSVISFIKEHSYPVTKGEIFNEFPGLSEIMLNFSIISDSKVINYLGQYLHLDRLKLYDFDKEYLNSVMDGVLSDGKPHHDEELFSYINTDNPDLLKRLYIFYPYSMFSFLECLYGDKYQFERPYIAKNEVEIGNPYERICEYILGKEVVDIEDIIGFAKELHYYVGSILELINSFNNTHIIINADQIAKIEFIGIDQEKYSAIEQTICGELEGTQPIRNITCWNYLSDLKVPWNEWLLYGLVEKYGSLLEAGVSDNHFRLAVPLVSKKGSMDVEKYANLKNEIGSESRTVDNLDNIDELIANLIVEEIEE